MKLLTSNLAKYSNLMSTLEDAGISVVCPPVHVPEIQSVDLSEVGRHKAEAMFAAIEEPVIVDDAALILDAYPNFPGAITKLVLQSVGVDGIHLLIAGKSKKASLICGLSVCEGFGRINQFVGEIRGEIHAAMNSSDALPLNDVFVPDGAGRSLTELKRIDPNYEDHRHYAVRQLVAWLGGRR